MDHSTFVAGHRFRYLFLLFGLACIIVNVAPAFAKDVVIDWSTQTLTVSPAKVYNTMVVNVRLNNANTLLYDYKIDITATPRNPDDFGKIADLLTKMGVLATKNTPVNPDQGNGKYTSVKVASTVNYWKASVQPQDETLKQNIADLKAALTQTPSTCTAADVSKAIDFLVTTALLFAGAFLGEVCNGPYNT